MTRQRRDRNEEPFNAWVRGHPQLDSHPKGAALSVLNVDMVFHKYLCVDHRNGTVLPRQRMMFVEIKTHSATVPDYQADTLNVVHQIMPTKIHANTMRGRRQIIFHGVHRLQLSATDPTDSAVIRWDGRVIDVPTLVDILRFAIDPETLRPIDERSHHKMHPVLDEAWMR